MRAGYRWLKPLTYKTIACVAIEGKQQIHCDSVMLPEARKKMRKLKLGHWCIMYIDGLEVGYLALTNLNWRNESDDIYDDWNIFPH